MIWFPGFDLITQWMAKTSNGVFMDKTYLMIICWYIILWAKTQALTGERFPIMRKAVSVESNKNAIRLECPTLIKLDVSKRVIQHFHIFMGRRATFIILIQQVYYILSLCLYQLINLLNRQLSIWELCIYMYVECNVASLIRLTPT